MHAPWNTWQRLKTRDVRDLQKNVRPWNFEGGTVLHHPYRAKPGARKCCCGRRGFTVPISLALHEWLPESPFSGGRRPWNNRRPRSVRCRDFRFFPRIFFLLEAKGKEM